MRQPPGGRRPHLPPQERHARKQRVLARGTPSITRSIADAVVVKDEDLFFLAKPDGTVPLGGEHGFGLYYHDCRYLHGYELTLADTYPEALVSSEARGFMAVFELTNPDLRMVDGQLIPKEEIGITWERTVDSAGLALHDVVTFQNFGLQPIEFPVSLTFQAGFEDIFAVRGLLAETPGTPRPPRWTDSVLHLAYEGADGLSRSLSIHCAPAPQTTDGTTARFHLALQPRERTQLLVSLVLAESADPTEVEPRAHPRPVLKQVQAVLHRSSSQWRSGQTEVRSDSLLLNGILDRSLGDLRVLRSAIGSYEFFAAGVPWFATLFGRDSLITALQTLAYDPKIAERTLRLLAQYQGQRVDDWRDEQPGKILHELRVGEMARLGEIPHTPYYGTVDATPLFLVLVGQHAAWTGDLRLFKDLRGNVELALEWMSKYGDPRGDGYIAYQSASEKGLINQGWKDSGDAIVNADGSLATPPIALVEVQGYAYLARLLLADLYRRVGEPERADRLRGEAEALRARFNRDFWIEDLGFYALALQAGSQPAAVVSSNPGHALWSGIVDPRKARQTAERLMADDLFTGWGIRTLSERERRYSPIAYHLGTVWPHDNSLAAAGLRRYGFDDAACRVAVAVIEAAMHFGGYRLPELFAGLSRADYGVPVRYPVACHPQAWAAGAVPYLVETLLGLVPEAFDHRLRIVRPLLPDFIHHIEVRRLRVGTARVDLRFERTSSGAVVVDVLEIEGHLDVVVQPRTSSA
ncbi:MAG: amylo-alpha-1,6-glucosidase [Chloroflexi bacterium]|nr:amylo-alpha-1,6-glucosidase [Chloroflexota bacterium]